MSNFLGCGNLASGFGCTVGDYVLEWRLGSRTGEVVFKSGKGTDVQIQAQHPFYNEIVQAGTLYPVLQYIYLNGEKYTSAYEDGSLYSPDLIDCFDPVVIDPITCSTILGSDVDYNFYLAYNNTTDTADDKSRTLTYVISETTQYFAWKFHAYEVSEQIKVYYCTAEDSDGVLLDNFICGTRNASGGGLIQNLYPEDYPTNPRIYSYNYHSINTPLYYITNLTSITYQTGDYLKIVIVGSVLEPSNTNTNWYLALQCLDSLDGTWYDIDMQKIDLNSIEMVYSSDPYCYYTLEYDTVVSTPSNANKTGNEHDIYRYLHIVYTTVGMRVQFAIINPIIGNTLRWENIASNAWLWVGNDHYGCTDLGADTISISRVGNDFTFTFTAQSSYDTFVSNIATIQAHPTYAIWQGITDHEDPRYYAKYQVYYRVSNLCGDTYTNNYLSFWLGCQITYDAVNKKITFTISIPTNEVPIADCDESNYIAGANISSFTGTLNMTIDSSNDHSHVMSPNPVGALIPAITEAHNITTTSYSNFRIPEALLNGVIDLTTLGFNYITGSKEYSMDRHRDRFTLLNYATHEERMNCWRLERMAYLRTENYADNYYEIVAEGSCTTTTTTIP